MCICMCFCLCLMYIHMMFVCVCVKLEVLVGEFDCFKDASAYFAKTFLTHEELLADRVFYCES